MRQEQYITYKMQFASLKQFFSIHCVLFCVDGHRKHWVWTTGRCRKMSIKDMPLILTFFKENGILQEI